jgi:K+-sensing histidine kinase KdpD
MNVLPMRKLISFRPYRMGSSQNSDEKWVVGQYMAVLAVVLFTTLILFNLRTNLGDANISLLYLLIVLFCATTARPGVTIFCGVISFLCYDYFLIPPNFDFIPFSPVKLLDPLAFLIVALVTSALAERSRQHAVQVATYRQANQFRTTLLHLISHNLRTPLATIKTALTSLLALKETPASTLDLLAAANHECDRLNRLIGNVLQLSRLDANAVQLHLDWNGLDEVISSVFSRWKEATTKKQLTASIPTDLPLIQFDFELIESVLTNLVENAFRHGQPPVHVTIQLQAAEVYISVEDKGAGVTASARDKLFQQFSTSKSGGLGLGLAVCKGLVEAHHGRLWVEFDPGSTRFIFSLPLVIYQDTEHESHTDR